MIILLASLLAGISIALLLYAMFSKKASETNNMRSRLENIRSEQMSIDMYLSSEEERKKKRRMPELSDIPFYDRVVRPATHTIATHILRLTPWKLADQIRRRLVLAGKVEVWSVNGVVIVWAAMIVMGGFMASVYASDNDMPFVQMISVVILGIAIGGLIPFAMLNSLIRKRQKSIQKQLPEVLDLMCVSVQAGLSFDGSLKHITNRMEGPLIDEFKHMMRDIRMGMSRKIAMRSFSNRIDLPEVRLFVTDIIQAEQLGTNMSTTMEAQADNMRELRRQRAKAAALKAPIKILFPLILFIFPAIFVVTLLPRLMMLQETLLK